MELAAADRTRLERIVLDRNSRQKHVYRAKIVLLAGEGLGSTRIARAVGKSDPTVRRGLTRFRAGGVDGLLRDATRPPGRKPLPRDTVARVVHLTLHQLPPDATHWSARRLAKAAGSDRDRTLDCNCACSSSLNTSSAFGRPIAIEASPLEGHPDSIRAYAKI